MVFHSDRRGVCVFDSASKAGDIRQGSGTSPEMSLKAALGDVALSPRSPEPAGDLAQAAGAGGTLPSAGAPSVTAEGGPGLGVLTLDDFAMRPKASRAFVVASSILRSGEVKRSLPQCPLEEVEVRLVVGGPTG